MAEYVFDLTAFESEELDDGMRERIVRCRDCGHAYEVDGKLDCQGPLTTGWDYYNDEPQSNYVKPDGFCSWAEPKKGDLPVDGLTPAEQGSGKEMT